MRRNLLLREIIHFAAKLKRNGKDPLLPANGGLASREADDADGSRHSSVRKKPAAKTATKNQRRGPHGRSSVHRGVTQHRRTKKWEAHIWDDRHQVYLGGFNSEEDAARAHDVMAIKCRGAESITNNSPDDYSTLLPQLQKLTKDEVRQLLMRKSSTFARGVSKYRGVTKHKGGKWEARLGQSKTRKHSYLGLFDSEEEAAKAYDTATIGRFGHGMAINFDLGQYGVASDDSQNDCTLDEHDSASSDMCRMSPFPDLVSTVPGDICNSNFPHDVVSYSKPLSNASPASRPGALLPKALFNMSGPGGNDCEQEARAFSTFLAHMPMNDDLLGRSLSSSMGGGYYEADKQAGMGIQGLEEADRRSSLLIQAELPQWGVDSSKTPRLGCFAAPGISAMSGRTSTPTQLLSILFHPSARSVLVKL
ncbi:hypothetical protein WJX82_003131 [Trebouxia sp. C0006]